MYYLLDCNDNVIANSKGYRTLRGAGQAQCINRELIWRLYDIKFEGLSDQEKKMFQPLSSIK